MILLRCVLLLIIYVLLLVIVVLVVMMVLFIRYTFRFFCLSFSVFRLYPVSSPDLSDVRLTGLNRPNTPRYYFLTVYS